MQWLHLVKLLRCVVEDLVVGDEAPVGGVAQVIGHGVKVIGVEVGVCVERKEGKKTRKCGKR